MLRPNGRNTDWEKKIAKMRFTRVASLAALAWLGAGLGGARGARAEAPSTSPAPEPRFGDRWQLSPSIDIETLLSPFARTFPNTPMTSLTVRPSADLFVLSNLSVGVEALYDVRDSQTFSYSNKQFWTTSDVTTTSRLPFIDTRRTTIGAGLRVGSHFAIGRVFSFWPRLGAGVWRARVQFGQLTFATLDPNAPSNFHFDETSFYAHLAVPVLVHIAPHLYVAIGLDVWTDSSHHAPYQFSYGMIGQDGTSATTVHASSTIGGWF